MGEFSLQNHTKAWAANAYTAGATQRAMWWVVSVAALALPAALLLLVLVCRTCVFRQLPATFQTLGIFHPYWCVLALRCAVAQLNWAQTWAVFVAVMLVVVVNACFG